MLESADRVLRAIEVFHESERDLSLSDIAERLSLPKSSVHRLLATLIEHDFIERDPLTRRYRLGIRLFEIGASVLRDRGLQSVAYPVVKNLALTTGETCHLAVLSGTDAVYIYKVDGASSIIMSSRMGGRAPCYATSIGKVLLAWGGDELFTRVVEAGLRPYTHNTITNPAKLKAELEAIRFRGYALDLEELEQGLRCVATSVRDHFGRVVAAIGIAGPSWRLSDNQLDSFVQAVMTAGDSISRNLGYLPDQATAATGS
ncbi:MAG: IclR family transcriptional regulator [Chloroflexi bacterium]|nr:IclR family transcriptional regulator [Chloroflexota bacterium]